ncbi:MAG: zinc-dependent alcohol dehydrogenase family protein [Trueperaceae bacterium]|nr:zinc-dependent alcohol dehydrogenase family protein [Trueperaceae bacterium]
MISAQILSPQTANVSDLPRPQLGPHDVLIEVKNAGICGTDLHIWHGSYALAQYPLVPGHEFSGVVAEIGDEVSTTRVGEHVTADPNLPCNHCYFCQKRQFNQCLNLKAVGVTRNGGFARYVVVPESAVFPIGDLSFAAAAMLEPLACVVWGLKQVQIQAGDSMLIFGAGPMGLLMLQAVKTDGAAQVVVIDREEGRLKLARELGATATVKAADFNQAMAQELSPFGFDVVADATGLPKVIQDGFQYLRSGGKFWVFGVAPDKARVEISPYEIFRRDLKIIGSFALNKTFHESIALVKAGAVKLEPLISHQLPLERFAEAMHFAEHDPDRLKVQFHLD